MPQEQFTGRRMKRNHSNALPRYIIAYAAEKNDELDSADSTISRGVFHRGSFISCRLEDMVPKAIRPRIVTSPQEFWSEIGKLSAVNYTTWVIGHSILHDMLISGMPEEFTEARLTVDWPRAKRIRENNNEDDPHSNVLVIINNPPTIIACRSSISGGRVVVVDLLNWFGSSLSDIEETLDRDREDWRHSINGYKELACPSMEKAGVVLSAFLRLCTWSRKHDVGMFRYTAASQAMSAYRHRFMTHDICVHDNDYVKGLERQAMFGGRTELFRAGSFQEKMHQLDVSSLFPSVMKHGYFPIRLNRSEPTAIWSDSLPDIQYGNSVATCWLRTIDPIYPVRTESGIIYPVGEFCTVLCGEELAHAHWSGALHSVQSWAEYSTEQIFTSWVEYMWQLRKNHEADGDFIYAKLVKLMLNGLYGKFAQKAAQWVNVGDSLADEPWREWTQTDVAKQTTRRFRSFGYHKQEFTGGGEIASSFVAISAFVASAARYRMNQLRKIAGRSEVYYQGVDGLIVTEKGRQLLDDAGEISESTLGKLRHQLTVDEGEILGYCDYRLGSKVVKSGLSQTAILQPDGELLQQISLVNESLFGTGEQRGPKRKDAYFTRQAMAIKGVMADDGVIWPYQLNQIMTNGSDISTSVA
jgi:hypothetical protein